MIRSKLIAGLVGMLMVLTVLGPAQTALAGPIDLSPHLGNSSIWPDVAVSNDGASVYVTWFSNYSSHDAVFFARYNGKSWSAPQVLSKSSGNDAGSPRIAVDSYGNIHVVYAQMAGDRRHIFDRVWMASSGTDPADPNNWLAPALVSQNVAGNLASFPHVGADPVGNVWIAFGCHGAYNGLFLVRWTKAGYDRSIPAAPGSTSDAVFPSVSGDRNGGAHVIWDNSANILYGLYKPGIGWTGQADLTGISSPAPAGSAPTKLPNVTVDIHGNVTYNSQVSVAGWSGDSYTLAGVREVFPDINTDVFGNVHFVAQHYYTSVWGISYKGKPAGQGWGSLEVVSSGNNNRMPAVTSDVAGNVYVAWGDEASSGVQLHSRMRTKAGSWGKANLFPGSGATPSMASGSDGVTHLVWSYKVSGKFHIVYQVLNTVPNVSVTINPDGPISSNGSRATSSLDVTLGLSGTGSTKVVLDNTATFDSPDVITRTLTPTTTWTLVEQPNHTATVYAKFLKAGGGVAGTVSDTIMIDRDAPVLPQLLLFNGDKYTNNLAATATLSAFDVSGVYGVQFSDDGGNTYGGVRPYSPTMSNIPTKRDLISPGVYTGTVYAKFLDYAMNVSDPISSTIIIETNAPKGTVHIETPTGYTNNRIVTVTVVYTDDLSGVNTIQISNSATGGPWKTISVSPTGSPAHIRWDLKDTAYGGNLTNGLKNVSVRLIDSAGNRTIPPLTDSVRIDTAPPTGSIVLNGGAANTKVLTVTATLKAQDDSGKVASMKFGQVIGGKVVYGTWLPYAKTAAVQLTAGPNGTRTVYVRYRDAAGNVSLPAKDSILLQR